MESHEFLALRLYHEMYQADWAQALGISQTYVSQIERGERPVPEALAEEVERRFAIGSPQSDDEQLWYHVGVFHASGEIEVPDDPSGILTFESRSFAAEYARRLRDDANVHGAMVVPVWENGTAIVVGRRRKTDKIDPELFGGLVSRFVRNREAR